MSSGQGPDLPKPSQRESTSSSETSSQPNPQIALNRLFPAEVHETLAAGDTSKTMRALAGMDTQPQTEKVTPQRMGELDGMLHAIKDGTRSGKLDIKIGNTTIQLGYKDILGDGGSKSVRRIVLDGQEYALGLPNPTDSAATLLEKWSNVQREPGNTERMREMGFLTNPVCRLVPVEINGVTFEAVLMTPYDKLPYEVRDSKTARQAIDPATGQPKPEMDNLFPATLDAPTFREAMQGVVQDVVRLVQNGVRLSLDSFSVAVVDGKIRLYFSDLGTARFDEKPQDADMKAYCKSCITDAIRTVLGVTSLREETTHSAFFEGQDFNTGSENNIYDQLTTDVLKILG